MSCTHATKQAGPAPIWRRAVCPECRAGRRADALISFALACRRAERAPTRVLARSLTALDLPYSMPRPRRARIVALVRQMRIPATIGTLCIGAAGLGYTRYIDIDPNITVPVPTISGPNAFDDFQRAAALAPEDKLIERMLSPEKSIETVQVDLPADPGQGMPANTAPAPHVYSLAEKEELLRQSAPALATIRLGLGHPYLAPPIRSFSTPTDYRVRFRALSSLLQLEGNTAAARGDWNGAIKSGIDAIDFGIKMESSSVAAGKLEGIRCESMGRRILWDAVDHATASDARAAAARIESLANIKPSTADTIKEEEYSFIAGLLEVMRKPGWRSKWWNEEGERTDLATYVRLLPYSKTRLIRFVERYLDRQIAMASAAYAGPDPESMHQELATDGPGKILEILPGFYGLRLQDAIDNTENGLLAAAFALRAYWLDHGKYPVGLQTLVGRYLRGVPADPFGTQPGLRYRRINNSYFLYSVGPDQVDNDGTPIYSSKANATASSVSSETTGDIVAGANRF